MAQIAVSIPPRFDMPSGSIATLRIGSENAASLAASTPAGGTAVTTCKVWDRPGAFGFGCGAFGGEQFGVGPGVGNFGDGMFGYGEFGINNAPPVTLRKNYTPDDVDATLPVGVTVTDPAGNQSTVTQTIIQLADTPDRPTNQVAAATENPNEASITWTASRHIS